MGQLEHLKNLSAIAITTCLYCGACALTGAIYRLGDAALFAVTIADIAKATMLFVPLLLIYAGLLFLCFRMSAKRAENTKLLMWLSIVIYVVLTAWSAWEGAVDWVTSSVFPILFYVIYSIRRMSLNAWEIKKEPIALFHLAAGAGLLSFYTGWGFAGSNITNLFNLPSQELCIETTKIECTKGRIVFRLSEVTLFVPENSKQIEAINNSRVVIIRDAAR